MAAADRVNAIRVIAEGDFGRDVAARIARVAPIEETADFVVFAAWRPMPAMFDRIDALAFERGFSWIPIVHADPELRAGPLVVPGAGPCYGCSVRRARQHSPRAAEDEAIEQAYDRDPHLGPRGYLPAVAAVGAALALEARERWIASAGAAAGRVTFVDFVRSASRVATVIGVHGCARCGAGRGEELRSIDRLERDVAVLTAEGAVSGV